MRAGAAPRVRMRAAFALLLLGVLAAAAHAQPVTPDQRAAIGAAERWLARVDAQRYADAWTMGSESFRKEVDRKRWNDGIRDLRREYGRVASRKAEKAAFVGSAPDAGDAAGAQAGAEMSILFATRFAGGRQATEELIMVLEQDGLWRVAGYHIQ